MPLARCTLSSFAQAEAAGQLRELEGHGDARVEHVAQLDEDDALLVAAQRRKRQLT